MTGLLSRFFEWYARRLDREPRPPVPLTASGPALVLVKPREWPEVLHVPDAETAKELYGTSFGLPSRDDPPRPVEVLELVERDHRLRKEPNQ